MLALTPPSAFRVQYCMVLVQFFCCAATHDSDALRGCVRSQSDHRGADPRWRHRKRTGRGRPNAPTRRRGLRSDEGAHGLALVRRHAGVAHGGGEQGLWSSCIVFSHHLELGGLMGLKPTRRTGKPPCTGQPATGISWRPSSCCSAARTSPPKTMCVCVPCPVGEECKSVQVVGCLVFCVRARFK